MSAAESVFYYDGQCGMCVGFVRWMERCDRNGAIIWTAYQSLETPPVGVTWDGLERAAYFVSDTGEVTEGFYAIRSLLHRVPKLALIGLLLSLPGSALVGPPVYRFIARNRHRISSCAR